MSDSVYLEIINREGNSTETPLLKDRLIIGRSPNSSDIVIDDPRVSRAHAQIMRRPEGVYTLTDLRSANGTIFEDAPIPPNTPILWPMGKPIQVGSTKIVLRNRQNNKRDTDIHKLYARIIQDVDPTQSVKSVPETPPLLPEGENLVETWRDRQDLQNTTSLLKKEAEPPQIESPFPWLKPLVPAASEHLTKEAFVPLPEPPEVRPPAVVEVPAVIVEPANDENSDEDTDNVQTVTLTGRAMLLGELPYTAAYYPREVAPRTWQPFYAYIYTRTAQEHVQTDSVKQMGRRWATNRQTSEVPAALIAEGAPLIATPLLEGFQFNPPNAALNFFDEWHRFDFKIRASDDWVNRESSGVVIFSVMGVIIAELPIRVRVGGIGIDQETVSTTGTAYRTVFASHSMRDEHIAANIAHAKIALQHESLRAVTILDSEDTWSPDLQDKIRRAELFQLFWSQSAASSVHVQNEWEHALTATPDQAGFIRPVYWTKPLANIPPALAALKFLFLPDVIPTKDDE